MICRSSEHGCAFIAGAAGFKNEWYVIILRLSQDGRVLAFILRT